MIPLDPFSLLGAFSYSALVVGTIVAQPAAALAAGALAAAHIARFDVLFGIIAATDLAMDCVWYILGARQGQTALSFILRLLRVGEGSTERVREAFQEYPALILISAKVLGGFGMMPVILFTAGAAGIPFRRYILLNAIGEAPWTGGLMAAGFFFSAAAMQINNIVGRASLALMAILAMTTFIYLISHARERLLR